MASEQIHNTTKYVSYYTSKEYTRAELVEKYRRVFESDAAFEFFLRKQFRRVEVIENE